MEWPLLYAKADFSITRAFFVLVTNWRTLDWERALDGEVYDGPFFG